MDELLHSGWETVELVRSVSTPWTLLLFGVLLFIIYGSHPIARWKYRHFPGPPFRFLVGHLPEIAKYGIETAYKIWAKEYGPVYCIYWGAVPHVIVSDPVLAHRISTRTAHKYAFPILRFTAQERQELNEIMLLVSGDVWKEMRNSWTPYMSSKKLETYFPMMLRSVNTLVEVVGTIAANGESVNIWPVMGRLTMDTIGSAAFGIQFNTLSNSSKAQSEDEALIAKLTKGLTADLNSLSVEDPMVGMLYVFPEIKPFTRLLAHLFPSAVYKAGFEARIMNRGLVHSIVSKVRAQDAGAAGTVGGGLDDSRTPELDIEIDDESFLATMAKVRDKSGQLKDISWVRSQALLFLIAGYETTALAITYCIYQLAANPDKEAKLLAEIDAFGRDTEPTYESLQNLPYLHAVMQETLRLLPPATFTVRQAKDDMQLGNQLVPKGAWMNTAIYSFQRDEAYWSEPEAFQPERFLGGENSQASKSRAYMPFGEGARVCPGSRFASQEVRLALLKLYQRFLFRLTPGQVPLATKTIFTMCPSNGEVRVVVHRRD